MTLIIDVSCRGVDETRRLQLEEGEEILVGRENRDVVLRKDQTLSRQHFLLRNSNSSIVVKHLSKTNPTLMAPEGSSEFLRVTETQTEFRTCRIIAGSHRFVATLESLDSATISGGSNGIWSDFEEEDGGEVGEVDATSNKIPLPSPLVDSGEQSEKPVFTWDDSVDEYSESPTIVERGDESVKSRDVQPTIPIPPPRKEAPAQKPAKPAVEQAKDSKQQDSDSYPDDFFD